jgi:dTDP-4-amino-4,6-dideoxygalactose transaminase
MHVPLFDLKRQYVTLREELLNAIDHVISSGQLILSTEGEQLEREVASLVGTTYAIGVANGSDALYIALKALNIRKGDLVITTPYTFFATVSAIVRNEATPIFADIDPVSMNVDLDQVENLLRHHPRKEHIKAVLPVHLFGQTCDLDRLQSIRETFRIRLIEDMAQSIGSTWVSSEGSVRSSGSLGDVSTISFFPTKNLGAYGDAGMILTSDDTYNEFCRSFRVHGSKERYFHEQIGINSRLDEIQAAVLRIKLRYLAKWTDERLRVARVYNRYFSESHSLADKLSFPEPYDGKQHVFHQYVIILKEGERDGLKEFLKRKGIGTSIYYPLPLHLQECFKSLGYMEGDFPVSERISRNSLALPIFPELTEEEIRYVVDQIEVFYSR